MDVQHEYPKLNNIINFEIILCSRKLVEIINYICKDDVWKELKQNK